MLFKSQPSGLTYVANLKHTTITHIMSHMVGCVSNEPSSDSDQACFSGGLMGLASKNAPTSELSSWYTEVWKPVACFTAL